MWERPTRPPTLGEWAIVALLTAAVIALGCYELTTRSIWLDEGASISIASQHGTALFRAITRDGGNFCAYYLGLHVLIALFGTGTVAIRLPSVLVEAATVPVTFLLGRRVLGVRVGLFAAALVGFSLPLVFWSQQARGYSLGGLLATCSTLAFVVAIETGKRSAFVWYGVLSVALCYTLLIATLVIVAQLVSLLFYNARGVALRRLVSTVGAIVVACIPLGLLAFGRGAGQLRWLKPPNPLAVRQGAAFLASSAGGAGTTPSAHLLNVITLTLFAIAVVVVPLDSLRSVTRPGFGIGLFVVWLGLPPTAAYVISRNFQPVFLGRYFIICLPAVALVLGAVLGRLRPAAIGWAACAALCVLRYMQIPSSYGLPLDDWRGATNAILESSERGDCIGFFSNDGRVDFGYYLDQETPAVRADQALPRPVLPVDPWKSDPVIVEEYASLTRAAVDVDARSCRRFWLVISHDGSANGTREDRSHHLAAVELRFALQSAYPLVTMQTFKSITVSLYSDDSTAQILVPERLVPAGENSTAAPLDGSALAARIKAELSVEVESLHASGVTPGLGTILVGDDAPSARYIAMKHEDCAEVGIASFHQHLAADTTQDELNAAIAGFNDDPAVDAYLVQLPLPKGLDEEKTLLRVDPDKDVDGLHPINLGRLVMGVDGPLPCTPAGIVELLAANDVAVAGKNVVIIGRGLTIGRPLALLMALRRPGCNAAVTVVHTGVPDLDEYVRRADVVVAAAGRAGLVTAEMVKPGAAVVGAGVTFEGRKLLSDVADGVEDVAGFLTPRIGGVGPMTRAMLLKNAVLAARRRVR